ncbi:MAG: PIN domain-containing protein [Armatimonadetes bacterium]|nr:PIN domain-containing protein [Armatimonadota bacterium]
MERKDGLIGNDALNEIVLDSVFIFDFEAAQILGLIFRLKYRWVVTDFIERELKTSNLPLLKQMGLEVVALTPAQVEDIAGLAQCYIGPSVPDLSCLVYARDNKIPLVTRDAALRRTACEQGVEVLDTHHILIELVDQEIINRQDAASALEEIQKKLRTRRSDWARLIQDWRQ